MDSVQNTVYNLHEHINRLTERGEFKSQAARTVYVFCAQRMAVNPNPARGLRTGYVMAGSDNPAVMAGCTGLSTASVYRVLAWLEEHCFIRRSFTGIELVSTGEESEAERKTAYETSLRARKREMEAALSLESERPTMSGTSLQKEVANLDKELEVLFS